MKGPFYLIEPVERDIHWLAERLGVLSGETITPKDGLSLVAGRDGQIVGHLMFARSLLDAPRRLVAVHVVSPSAGMPGCQKRGIGSALVRNARKALAQRAVPLVLLEGDPGYPGAADADLAAAAGQWRCLLRGLPWSPD